MCLDKRTILSCNIILNCESSGQYIKLSQGQNFPMSNLIMPLQIILRRNVNDRHKLHSGVTLHINYSIPIQGRSLISLYGKSSVLLRIIISCSNSKDLSVMKFTSTFNEHLIISYSISAYP